MEDLIFLNNLPLDLVLQRALKATKSTTDSNKWLLNDEIITITLSNTWHSNKDPNIYRGAIELVEHCLKNKVDEEDPFSTPYNLAINLLKQEFHSEYCALQSRVQQETNSFVSPLDSNTSFLKQKNEIISLLNIEDPELLSLLDEKLNKLTHIAIGEVISTVGLYESQFVSDSEEFIVRNSEECNTYSNNTGLEEFLKDNFLPRPVKNKFKIK